MRPPWAGPVWTPGARLAGFTKRTIINCYTQNMKALGIVVSEKKIFYVSSIVSLWDLSVAYLAITDHRACDMFS